MTKPSITENFINEPIPEDKAASTLCAAVRKSNAIIKAASSAYMQPPPSITLYMCFFQLNDTRWIFKDYYLRAKLRYDQNEYVNTLLRLEKLTH